MVRTQDTENPRDPSCRDDGWFRGKSVTVMGLGQFGGGLGVVRWLHAQGARVLVTDAADEKALGSSLAAISAPIQRGEITLRLGEHRVEDFASADLVVANAAVGHPWDNRYLCAARQHGVEVTTEIRLAIARLGTRHTIGITGSAGKSTTAAMAACALEASGRRVRVGGNFGGSLLGTSPSHPEEWIVLELSSAQLWWLSEEAGASGWSPTIAALTNIAPNHVDWHGSLSHYIGAKAQIRCSQPPGGIFLSSFGAECPQAAAAAQLASPDGAWWDGGWHAQLPDTSSIRLAVPGEHQQRNARLALSIVAACAEVDRGIAHLDHACTALAGFAGLEHRLQFVGECEGIRCFNDSKATTPEATLLAIDSLGDPARIHLIAGGYDKKVDLSAISRLAPTLAGLYAIGATEALVGGHSAARRCGTLDRAVDDAFSHARHGDIVLLSPGCASWDQFLNFEARGRCFVALVHRRSASARC